MNPDEDESGEDEDENCENCDEDDFTPENCPMGSFSPGTEMCEFCGWREVCEEEFLKWIKNRQR